MALKIRLSRGGSKKRPFYRIVVQDVESPRDGKFLEVVGTYDPLKDPAEVTLKEDRVAYWIGEGALPTGTVSDIIKKEKASAVSA